VAQVLGCPLEELGDASYQIERSAHPATQSWKGRPPSQERIDFLCRLLQESRSTARVLILHGKIHDPAWAMCNSRLSAAFLGLTYLPRVPDEVIGRRSIGRWPAQGQTVLHTWALNGMNVNREYLDRVGEIVEAALV